MKSSSSFKSVTRLAAFSVALAAVNSTHADHGPGTSGGGASTQSGEALKPGKFAVEFREDYSAVLAVMVAEGTLDVAIAALPYAFEHVDTEPLGDDRLVVALPSNHVAARAGRITLAQLRDAPAVTLDRAHCLSEQVAGFCASHDVNASVVCHSSQLTTVLELVGAGLGVSIVPAIAASRHNTPRCAYVPLVGHDLRREIVAVWRRGGVRTAAAQGFVECVRDVIRSW